MGVDPHPQTNVAAEKVRFSEPTKQGAARLLAALETIAPADRADAVALFAKAAIETGWWVQ